MKFFVNIICCSLFHLAVYAQRPISGRVLNEANDQPIEGASVYFNNTSLGTLTNSIGTFYLPDAITGELVVSFVGFERLVYKISALQIEGKSFTFKLTPKTALLPDVLMLPDVTRRKYLQMFQDNFLGITEEADATRIQNLGDIYFVGVANEKNSFKAMADNPLIITNNKLGYRIRFELVEFYLNQTTLQTSFYGYTRYEEMGNKKKWINNRKNTYYGSTLHFFRSLIGDSLHKEKFDLHLVRTDTIQPGPNEARKTPRKVDVAWSIKASDIVKKDSLGNSYSITWKHKLMVQYLKDPKGKTYLRHKRPIGFSSQPGTRSYLHLLSPMARVDEYGIIEDPMSLFYTGYWGYEKAANLLPYNYFPDKN